MSDPNGGSGAAAQPGNPAAQPSQQPGVPSNYVQVDPAELSRLRRAEEQVRGMQPFYETARRHGFDKPEAFESYGQKMERLKKSGLSIDALISSMENEPGAARGAPEFDPENFKKSIREELLGEVKGELTRAESMSTHKAAMTGYSKTIDELTDELVGKGSDEEKAVWKAVLKERAETARRDASNLYPEGHPLHQYDWQPLDKAKLAPVFESVKKMRTAIEARRLAEKGAAVNQTTGTPAGNATGQGKPTPTSPKDRHFSQLSRDEKVAKAKEMIARRGTAGAPVSSVGG